MPRSIPRSPCIQIPNWVWQEEQEEQEEKGKEEHEKEEGEEEEKEEEEEQEKKEEDEEEGVLHKIAKCDLGRAGRTWRRRRGGFCKILRS